MGSLYALGLAEEVEAGRISLVGALRIHLVGNHYPPVRESLAPACEAAIRAVNEGEPGRRIDIPDTNGWAPAEDIIEALNLEAFIRDED